MKKIIYITIFISVFTSTIKAEIRQILDNFPKITFNHSRVDRMIKGSFEFVELPGPSKISTINYTLEIVKLYPSITETDWPIKISKSNNDIKIISHTNSTWNGPHQVGDILTGSIECMPLSSGLHSFKLEAIEDFLIKWVFDENGNLLALDNRYIDIGEYEFLNTYFFDDDVYSIEYKDQFKNEAFDYKITITPTPKIGEVSVINIRLKAKIDYPNGFDFILSSCHLNVISYPEFVDYKIFENQVIDLKFSIIPEAYNYDHDFNLQITKDLENNIYYKYAQDFRLNFIFNEDKSLKFVFDQAFNWKKEIRYHLKSFKTPKDSDRKHVKFLKTREAINIE